MKRKKCYLGDFERLGITYLAFSRVKNLDTGERGYRFIVEKPLTQDQTGDLQQFQNVTFGAARYKYAPEISYSTVTLWDKCLKGRA